MIMNSFKFKFYQNAIKRVKEDPDDNLNSTHNRAQIEHRRTPNKLEVGPGAGRNDSVIEYHGVKDISMEPFPPPSGFLRVSHNSKFNWSIVLTKNIDREDTQFDSLNGGGGIPNTVTFQVDNEIETGPQFLFNEFNITIPEPIGNQDNLVLRLSKQSRSVDLSLLNMLDYDKGVTSYNMTLTAKVSGAPRFSTTTNIFVHVTDVDDQNPTFTKDVYRCSIPETVMSDVIRCDNIPTAYDQDKGLNETITYEIVGIADPTFIPFTIDAKDGRILVNGTIDREKKDFYAFTIMAKQIDKPLLRRVTSLVYVQIQDANDNSPVMSSATYDISIPENLPDGTFVLKVAATDLDKGNNSLIGFRLSGDYTPFEIDEQSGVISVKNSALLDRETHQYFKFEVQAFETATKEKHTSNNSSVMITLLDENDNSPEFNSSNKQLFVVKKTISDGTTIGQVGLNIYKKGGDLQRDSVAVPTAKHQNTE
ncbi:hypothetical protein FSP39_010699 [Pinctada imbricata]|uniref:Cadherin domain-containing protein n=1 Tax=Pinctada imbricata TaxID=66713 RepID=A0AA89BPA2_PINIB|nr:hypothetical protein FSP39_010699 [Pinctada imbricata]